MTSCVFIVGGSDGKPHSSERPYQESFSSILIINTVHDLFFSQCEVGTASVEYKTCQIETCPLSLLYLESLLGATSEWSCWFSREAGVQETAAVWLTLLQRRCRFHIETGSERAVSPTLTPRVAASRAEIYP